MKKINIQITSVLLSIALTVTFGFLTYFILSAALKDETQLSDPLPDDGGETPPNAAPDEDIPPSGDQNTAPEEDPDEDEEKKRGSEYIRAKTNGLNVRTGPGTSYTSLGSLDQNDMLTYKGKTGNWYITEFKNRTAYVSADKAYTELFAMEHEIDETIEQVIAEGFRLLGSPYVYGAVRLHDGKGNFLKNFDKGKYDCSSLMQYIFYYGADVVLDVTTRTQVVQGRHVAKKDLQRGDLMFFTNSARYNKTGIERIGHVALYLGDNYILHTATDHAVIEPISAQRWKYYIESRRVA